MSLQKQQTDLSLQPEKIDLEKWNKLSASKKKEYWDLKTSQDQKRLCHFLTNDDIEEFQLNQTNGESLTLKKIKLPLLENEEWGHLVADVKGQKQLYVAHKYTGYILPFTKLELGGSMPDHVCALSLNEVEERLIATHPIVKQLGESTKNVSMRENFIIQCKKKGLDMPIFQNYWKESLCYNYPLAESNLIYNYKTGITISNASRCLMDQVHKFFNVTFKYLYEIDINTQSAIGSLMSIPSAKPILVDEIPQFQYKTKNFNPPLALAQLLTRIFAMQYGFKYCSDVVIIFPTTERISKTKAQCLKTGNIFAALNKTFPVAGASIIDTGDVLNGLNYSFKICKCNNQDKEEVAFCVLELNEIYEVIETFHSQVGKSLFEQLFDPLRTYFVSMLNLNITHVAGLTCAIQLINLDHVVNIVNFVSQACIESKPIVSTHTGEISQLDIDMEKKIQSYKTHEPIKVLFKKILPDGYFEDNDKAFHLPINKKLSINFLAIKNNDSEETE